MGGGNGEHGRGGGGEEEIMEVRRELKGFSVNH